MKNVYLENYSSMFSVIYLVCLKWRFKLLLSSTEKSYSEHSLIVVPRVFSSSSLKYVLDKFFFNILRKWSVLYWIIGTNSTRFLTFAMLSSLGLKVALTSCGNPEASNDSGDRFWLLLIQSDRNFRSFLWIIVRIDTNPHLSAPKLSLSWSTLYQNE